MYNGYSADEAPLAVTLQYPSLPVYNSSKGCQVSSAAYSSLN